MQYILLVTKLSLNKLGGAAGSNLVPADAVIPDTASLTFRLCGKDNNEDKTPIFWFNIDGRTLLSHTKPRESIKELGLDTLLPSIVNIIPGYYEPSLEPKELGSVVVTLGGPDI